MLRRAAVAVSLLLPLAALAEVAELFVAVGAGGRRLSSHDGLTWQHDQRWSEAADPLFEIAFGAGRFVAVGGAQHGRLLTTTDGRIWEELPSPAGPVSTIVFARDRFIAVQGGTLLHSRDGLIFSVGPSLHAPGLVQARRSASGDTEAGYRIVVIGDLLPPAETRRVAWRGVTGDGTRWEASAIDTPAAADIAHGSGHFIVVGPAGLIESSHDGETWTRRATASDAGDFKRVVWTGQRFLVTGERSAWSSADGFEWQRLQARVPGSIVCATEGGPAISLTTGGHIQISRDLSHWQNARLPTGPELHGVAHRPAE